MPEMNQLDAIIAIRGEFPDAKIIVLTTYVGDVQVLRALKAGAPGMFSKNTLHKNLLDTISGGSLQKELVPWRPPSNLPSTRRTMPYPWRSASAGLACAAGNANKQIADLLSISENGKGPGKEYPLQAECQRSDPCSHHRPQA